MFEIAGQNCMAQMKPMHLTLFVDCVYPNPTVWGCSLQPCEGGKGWC